MVLARLLHSLPTTGLVVMVAALLGSMLAPATFAQSLELGFTDTVFEAEEPLAGQWLNRALVSGGSFVRIGASWAAITRVRPVDPANPADPAYDWHALDAVVRAVAAHELQAAVTVSSAPTWAQGPARPKSVSPGAWRPDPTAYGLFAQALATRYSGSYPDPLHPGTDLPRVRYWQAWNEPNLAIDLAPQWVRQGNRFLPASPGLYRSLLNAFYRGIKTGSPGAFVISAGTAPFGDLRPDEHNQGNQRMPPVQFVEELLCLVGAGLAPERCTHPAHFDILDHHPYAIYGPFTPALNAGDVSIPDLAKLTTPLRKAERDGLVLPRKRKALWVTEVSYDSDPPDPHGVPMRQHARWVEQTLYELWHEVVSMISWYLIRDQPPIPSYAASYQSGLYFYDGTPKLSERAFRFPFVIASAGTGRHIWWTRAPAAGRLSIQQRTSHGWHTRYTVAVREHQALERPLPRGAQTRSWRAIIDGQTSLEWPV